MHQPAFPPTTKRGAPRLPRRRAIALGILLLTVAVATAAATSGAPAGTRSVSNQGQEPNLAALKAKIDKYRAKPKFVAPGPPLDASKARGKTIFNIPVSLNIPIVALADKTASQLAKQLGINFVEYANQGQPAQWVQGIKQGIAQKADLIALQYGMDPRLLQPQIAEAHSAGILIQADHLYDKSFIDEQKGDHVDAAVQAPYSLAAELEADYAIWRSKGNVDALIIGTDTRPSKPIVAAITAEFAKQCPNCKVRSISIPLVDWATKIRTTVQSEVLRDKNLNYVIPIFDGMALYAVPAIEAANAGDRVKIVTYNGTPAVLNFLRTGNIVVMDVGESWEWQAWEDIDMSLRALLHLPLHQDTHGNPIRIFDKSNVAQAGVPAKLDDNFGSPTQFLRLWGVK